MYCCDEKHEICQKINLPTPTQKKQKNFCTTEKYAIVKKQENNGKSVKSFRDNEVKNKDTK